MVRLKPLGIQTKITWLAFGIVLISLLSALTVFVVYYVANLEKEIGSRALAIARTLAQIEKIQDNVGLPGGVRVIQPIAEKTRLATDVEYVVILDMEGTRYSHPSESFLGQKFGGGDEAASFQDNEYVSHAIGILGPSVRAFVPIKTNEGLTQVGVVVVGILTPTFYQTIWGLRFEIFLPLLVGMVAGIFGSIYLARDIKKILFNLEPREIARLLEERVAILQSMADGIIAIDKEHKITIFNEVAQRLLNVKGDWIGKSILDAIPDSRLPQTIARGERTFNQERIVGNATVLASRFPIIVKGEIVGAVSLIRDKTEVHRLAVELTGVKQYIEALRVQSHEYLNKLHTIAGLLQLKRYTEAIDYVFALSEEQQELIGFLGKNIKDYSVAGLLLGKYGRAKELQIDLYIDRNSLLQKTLEPVESTALVIILGNLLENAMEAVQTMPSERRKVWFSLEEKEDSLQIKVKDYGQGIPKEFRDQIFTAGFSTKNKSNRGYGLPLIRRNVQSLGGELILNSTEGQGTEFIVNLPKLKGSV